MSLSSAFRHCLDAGDASRLRGLWHRLYPSMPQPGTAAEAEIVMHTARTSAESVCLAKRLYSHAWLEERGYRSALPDELRPKRLHPVIVPMVGVSVRSLSTRPDRREEAKALERIMAEAGGEMIAMGITDPARVSQRIWQAREDYLAGRLRAHI